MRDRSGGPAVRYVAKSRANAVRRAWDSTDGYAELVLVVIVLVDVLEPGLVNVGVSVRLAAVVSVLMLVLDMVVIMGGVRVGVRLLTVIVLVAVCVFVLVLFAHDRCSFIGLS
jgi:hypothetical protein